MYLRRPIIREQHGTEPKQEVYPRRTPWYPSLELRLYSPEPPTGNTTLYIKPRSIFASIPLLYALLSKPGFYLPWLFRDYAEKIPPRPACERSPATISERPSRIDSTSTPRQNKTILSQLSQKVGDNFPGPRLANFLLADTLTTARGRSLGPLLPVLFAVETLATSC